MEDSTGFRLKRIIFRASHRGCKETDLILGQFCDRQAAAMNAAELDLFEQLLEENDADVWGWVSGKLPVPAHFSGLVGQLQQISIEY